MRKTQIVGHQIGGTQIGGQNILGTSQRGPARRPVLVPTNWAPISLFVLAYVAILGVLFAPEGYFNGAEPPTVTSE